MDKKSFVLYSEYKQYLEELTDSNCGKLIKAVFEYVDTKTMPDFKGTLKVVFMMICSQLDRDAEKYSTVIEKRREAGKLGGRPKKTEEEKQKKQKVFSEKQKKAKKADNVDVDVYVYDNDDVNEDVDDDVINYCSELETTSEPTEPSIIFLTLNDNSKYEIFNKDVIEWQELYPSVDIMQELRKMKGWLNANPKKRKTKLGIQRFINNWLSREQDKYKTSQEDASESSNPFLNMLEDERNIEL